MVLYQDEGTEFHATQYGIHHEFFLNGESNSLRKTAFITANIENWSNLK